MQPDKTIDGKVVMVHGGERNRRSTTRSMVGIAWKPISELDS